MHLRSTPKLRTSPPAQASVAKIYTHAAHVSNRFKARVCTKLNAHQSPSPICRTRGFGRVFEAWLSQPSDVSYTRTYSCSFGVWVASVFHQAERQSLSLARQNPIRRRPHKLRWPKFTLAPCNRAEICVHIRKAQICTKLNLSSSHEPKPKPHTTPTSAVAF